MGNWVLDVQRVIFQLLDTGQYSPDVVIATREHDIPGKDHILEGFRSNSTISTANTYIVSDAPKDKFPLPYSELHLPARKPTPTEEVDLHQLTDSNRTKRPPNMCWRCKANGSDKLAKTVCCLGLVCEKCCKTYFNLCSFSCPLCELPWTTLSLNQVLVDPEQTDETLRNVWKTIITLKQRFQLEM